MRNNKGFIAISLIYSFFLVFLIVLLSVVANYAHNRILLNDVKVTIKEKLNDLSEFNPIYLENKTYTLNEVVRYANDNWIVLSNTSRGVRLLLERSLTNQELLAALESSGISCDLIVQENKINMCLPWYSSIFCSYKNATVGQYNEYSWSISVVKKVVDAWFNENALLQKALARGALNQQEFFDRNSNTYKEYIRIPLSGELDSLNNEDISKSTWSLTFKKLDSGKNIISLNEEKSVIAHETKLEIRPIIWVKKG